MISMRVFAHFLRILLAWACLQLVVSAAPGGDVRCDKGAHVDREERCAYFIKFAPRDEDTKDARILQAYSKPASQVRSIALVVGVSDYGPAFEGGALPAAHADVERLKTFLLNQQFDEIIVLENGAATKEAIQYFLSEYIPNEASSFGGRARVLFAFSGHGVQDSGGSALALSNAETTSDSRGLYRLRSLQSDLQNAAAASWQMLALIDACYGGDIFKTGMVGGNDSAYWKKAAYVITAGSKGNLTWTIGDAKGSVFFQSFIDGIEYGTANSMAIQGLDPHNRNTIIDYGAIVTQAQALAETTRVIRNVELGVIRTAIDPKDLSEPWQGSMMEDEASPGAFFFLANSPAPKSTPIAAAVPRTDPRKFSLVNGAPDPWRGPDGTRSLGSYSLRGIDVSHFSGNVDWQAVKASGISFAYIKAAEYSGSNAWLQHNMDQLHIVGLPHGVYLYYDFCQAPDAQADNLLRLVPSGADLLPVAVAVDWFEGGSGDSRMAKQLACANSNKKQTADNILRVLQRLTAAYGRAPVLYLPSITSHLLDARFDNYPRWTADYTQRSLNAGRPTRDAIWSIWQYDGRGKVPGVAGDVDLNVFAGDRNAFKLFAGGGYDARR